MKMKACSAHAALHRLATAEGQRRRAFALRSAAAITVLGLAAGPAAALTISTTVGPQSIPDGDNLTVTNTGVINGGGNNAVEAGGNTYGDIDNQGSITTSSNNASGISLITQTAGGNISNSGTIDANGTAVDLQYSQAGAISNSGTITSGSYGFYLYAVESFSSLTNSGTVQSASDGIHAIWNVSSPGSITNAVGGTITAGGNGIYFSSNVSVDKVINAGNITAGENGIFLDYSSHINEVTNSGQITTQAGANDGHGIWVSSYSQVGAISNSGTIDTTANGFGDGIQVYYSTTAASISNTGTINAGRHGIVLTSTATVTGSITNDGTINAPNTGTGIWLTDSEVGGGITNNGAINSTFGITVQNSYVTGGPILNSSTGTITAYNTGIEVFQGSRVHSIQNAGTITGRQSSIEVATTSRVLNGVTNTGILDGPIKILGNNGSGGGINLLNSNTIDFGGSSIVSGDFTQQNTGALQIDLRNFSTYGVAPLKIGGNAFLDGLLNLSFVPGFTPSAGTFTLLDVAGTTTGTFSNYADGAAVYDGGPGVKITMRYTANDVNLETTVPELDASAASGALGFLAATLALAGERRRRRG